MMTLLSILFPPKLGVLAGARLERSFYGQAEHDGSWAGNVKEWSPIEHRWVSRTSGSTLSSNPPENARYRLNFRCGN